MKTRTIAILGVTAMLLLGGMFAVSQKMMGEDLANRRGSAAMMMRELDLTDDQKAKVKDIMESNRASVQPILEAMKANHEKLAALKGSFDESQVAAIAEAQGDLTGQMIVARQRVKSQIFGILTDDQKAKAAQLHQAMEQRIEDRMKSWGQKQDQGTGEDGGE